MALLGFPAQIEITLGSAFQTPPASAGNGLQEGQVVVVTKRPDNKWYENPDSSSAKRVDPSVNRLRFGPESFGGTVVLAGWWLCNTTADTWSVGGRIYATASGAKSNYTFKDMWNLANAGTTVGGTYYHCNVASYNAASMDMGVFNNGSNGPTVVAPYVDYIALMEEYVAPSGLEPDRTTYRYG